MDNYNYRLFDAVAYQQKHFKKQDMLNAKHGEIWKNFTTDYVAETANKLSAALLKLGVNTTAFNEGAAEKIAIISQNRPEWLITDIAVQQTGAILTPLYPTTNPLELIFILNDAQVKTIFVSDDALFDKIKSIQPEVPSLQNIFSFNEVSGVTHWETLLENITDDDLQKVEAVKKEIPASHVATIIYTSGTTGTPKGVMLTHENIVSNVYFSKKSFPFPDDPKLKVLSFLPLNHIFEKTVSYIYLFSGISIYYAQSLENIADNLREVKPDGFTTVPRLLEKVFEKIMLKGSELSGIKKALFYWSVSLAEKYDNRVSGGFFYNLKLKIANALVFKKWREALGGNINFIITGGAACQIKLLRIFNGAQIPVFEGYGPTENSPVICVNRHSSEGTKLGTVGPAIDGVTVKIAEDGEILCTGPSVMKGYYKRKDLTDETVINGWLHTGDIGVWDEGKFLKITDRKKELFKTSGGKYVAPQPIENKIKESPFIEQIMVVGENRKFVGALIVPAFPYLKEWMRIKEIEFVSNEHAIELPQVRKKYREVINEYNQLFNHIEQVKRFELLPKEWSIETGEMTPKMSLKRKVVFEKFCNEIDKIYDVSGDAEKDDPSNLDVNAG